MTLDTIHSRIDPETLYTLKSKFGHDLHRYALKGSQILTFSNFYLKVLKFHGLSDKRFESSIDTNMACFEFWYMDPITKEMFKITNTENMQRALLVSREILKLFIYSEDDVRKPMLKKKTFRGRWNVSDPTDFRKISCLFKDDHLPETYIRVKIAKNDDEKKQFGLYVREEQIHNMDDPANPIHVMIVDKITPNSIVEETGIISVGDEIIEVNDVPMRDLSVHQMVYLMNSCSDNLDIVIKSAKLIKILKPNQMIIDGFQRDFQKENQRFDGMDESIVYNA
ncbi:Partitioning defective 6 gamma [Thelohanellus kitauei]|uniref:Partitioning defective 6 gamma n=1 Tax=Thelohanellus kitauei TaxID=669202 RepID=A0A0C2NES4_THEKT|nr:Partitioning defective 6 gamma [Thelohanellus kitauei]